MSPRACRRGSVPGWCSTSHAGFLARLVILRFDPTTALRVFLSVCLGIFLAMAGAATPAAAGIYYEAVSETESGQDSVPYVRVEVRGWIEDERAKVMFIDSDHPLMKQGSWLLTRNGGRTVHRVDPETESYMAWDLAGAMGGMADAYESLKGMVEFSLEDTEVEKESEEDGPAMLGYETIHSTYQTSYTLVMRIMGSEQRIVNRLRQELWTTGAVDARMHGLWLGAEPPRTGITDLDAFLDQQAARVTAGFPLKTRVVTTTASQGRSSTTESVTEIIALDEQDHADDIFSIPPGYREVEMLDFEELMRPRH